MSIIPNTLELIGNTPLVRLSGPSEAAGCDIYGKCEFANPGASVKDRAALYIIQDAEERGQLKPGGRIVEGTAGNTGIGIALVANAKGYKSTIVMPETQSREKMDTLRALGAELITVPRLIPASVISSINRAALRKKPRVLSGPTSLTMSPTAAPISRPRQKKSGIR